MLPLLPPGTVLRLAPPPGHGSLFGRVVLLPLHGRFALHRVIRDAGAFVVTRGDASSVTDPPRRRTDLLGVATGVIASPAGAFAALALARPPLLGALALAFHPLARLAGHLDGWIHAGRQFAQGLRPCTPPGSRTPDPAYPSAPPFETAGRKVTREVWRVRDPPAGVRGRSPRAILARNLVTFAAFDAAAAALSAAGIPWAPLKGADLVGRGLYRMDERPMADADLLVPQGEFARARAALRAAGFAVPGPAGPEGGAENLVHEAGGNVGLHRALLPTGRYFGAAFACPADPFLARARRDAGGVRRLDATDTMFHLAAHLVYCHGFEGPRRMEDIRRFAGRFGGAVERERFARLLAETGTAPGVAALFHALERHGFGRFTGFLTPAARRAASPFHHAAAEILFRLAFTRYVERLHDFGPWLFSPSIGLAGRMLVRWIARRAIRRTRGAGDRAEYRLS